MLEFFRRLNYLLHRRRFDRELAGDLQFHREMAARSGCAPVGNELHWREESRDAWGWTWIERLFQDLRFSLRMIRKSPGFTLAAVLTLAVGAGVNIAAFGYFDFLTLRPLNVRQPGTLLRLHRRSPQLYSFVLPYPEMAFFRERAQTLSSVLALNYTTLKMDGEPKPIAAQFVTANWFADLGATTALGRVFDPATDDAPGAAPAVVLSYPFWQRRFGGDASIIGRVIRLNNQPATIIGVASPDFSGLSLNQPPMWVPIVQQPYFAAGSKLLTDYSGEGSGVMMWGRVRDGATPASVEGELRALAAELRKERPKDIWENERIASEPGGFANSLIIGGRRGSGTEQRDDLLPIIAMVGGLTLLILAVACANLGSLLLARGVSRDREIAIRAAVGAGRGRLVRQLLTESLTLAFLGCAAGLGVGCLLLRYLMFQFGMARWLDPTPDWRLVAFSSGLACAAAAFFGLAPALQTARRRHRSTAARQILIAAQVAASCVLLIVAALFVRAIHHAASDSPGFEYRNVLSIDPSLGAHGYSPSAARAYFDQATIRLLQAPGVDSVSVTDTPPFGNVTRTGGIELDGRTADAVLTHTRADLFPTLHLPLLLGRNFGPAETGAIIVSQSLARRLWPNENPIGKQLPFGDDAAGKPIRHTVVGVAGDARLVKLENPDVTQLYFFAEPGDLPGSSLVVRTRSEPKSAFAAIAAVLKSIDPAIQPSLVTLPDSLDNQLRGPESAAMAATALGGAALALACLGLVGVIAYAVSQRTREIGIRVALGARPGDVIGSVLRQFVPPVVIGIAIGIGGAAALGRVLRTLLFGIGPLDPLAYAGAVGLFALTVSLAAWLPARRALKVDPAVSLRCY